MRTRTDHSEIIRTASALKDAKLDEVRLLEKIARDAEYAVTSLNGACIEFVGRSERNFLEGKALVSMIMEEKKPSTYDFEAMGTTTDFPCSLSFEDGVYMFYLPPTPSVKIGLPAPGIGRYTGYLVKNLIRKFEKENGKIGMLASPAVVLEFGFTADKSRSRYYDADNRDNKRILDAMTGTFYPDDNVMEITTVHKGVIAERECTMVYVMEMTDLPSWLSRN